MTSPYNVTPHTVDPPQSPESPVAADPAFLRRAGVLCAVGGVIAVVGTAWGFSQEVPVAGATISAPQSAGVFQALELLWTLTHVLTFFGALGLARSGLVATSRAGRVGTVLAAVGMAAIIPSELAFIPFATSTDADPGPMFASTAIGLASMVAAAGFVVVGIVVLRARTWPGPARFLPLLTGLWVYIGLTPLVIADGRLFYVGIGIWNALLALMGVAIAHLGSERR